MSYLLTNLPILAMLASVVVAAITFQHVVAGVRAKHRIKTILAKDVDGRFHDMLVRARASKDMDVEARKVVEKAAERLSVRDKRLVYRGLNQGSRVGERRFIRELIS